MTPHLLVRVTGKFESIEEIENILIPTATGNVLLKDIAEVKDTYKEVTSISRLNGKESIGITIQKQADANTVMVSRRVNAELKKIMEESELDLEIVPIMDQAEYIELAIGNVGNNAIVGGLLAVLILLIFLKNIRSNYYHCCFNTSIHHHHLPFDVFFQSDHQPDDPGRAGPGCGYAGG